MATRTLAELYAGQGHYDRAVEIYEQLVEASPGDSRLAARLQELRGMAAVPPEAAAEQPDPRRRLIQRLEAWLARTLEEKERRCSRSS